MILQENSTSKLSSENVLEFNTTLKEFDIIWFADAHLDSNKSKVDFLHKILKENPKAFIIFGGDNHDLMQGKLDKRNDKSALKPDLKSSDYWNQLVNLTRKEIIDRYKDRIICWNTGNHETGALRNLEFDYLDFLLDNGRLGNRLYTSGYIIVKYKTTTAYISYPIYFQHAPPSGGGRSKGMLSVDLLLGQRPDAKAIITEHIHQTWIHPETVERLGSKNKLHYQTVWFIQAPTLKAEHEGPKLGFFHEKLRRGANTIGAIKLKFKLINKHEVKYLDMTPEYMLYY
jgi:hypothetical protein